MIRTEDLLDSIEFVKEEVYEEINVDSAEKMILNINKGIATRRKRITKSEFIGLVMQEAIKLELPYKYCKVAYLYYGKKRKNNKHIDTNKYAQVKVKQLNLPIKDNNKAINALHYNEI